MTMTYFIPTSTYKAYVILDLIFKKSDLTQRDISKIAAISLSTVNSYIDRYESQGYVKREYKTKKIVKYSLTNKGIEYMRFLNIGYLSESQLIYNNAKEEMYSFLIKLMDKGYKDIILYGAGEVAEIIIQTINGDKSIPLNIVSLIDDNISKQDTFLLNIKIKGNECIKQEKHDCIMVSSYTNHDSIMEKLVELNYDLDKVEYFFK